MCLDQFRTGGEKFFDSEKKNLTARNKFLFTFCFFFTYILRRVSLAQLFLVCAEFPRLYRRRNLSTVPFLVCFGESSKGKLMGGGGGWRTQTAGAPDVIITSSAVGFSGNQTSTIRRFDESTERFMKEKIKSPEKNKTKEKVFFFSFLIDERERLGYVR